MIEKSWGREELIFNGSYCMKLLVYTRPMIASSLHFHTGKHESFYIASGVFEIETGSCGELTKKTYYPGDHLVLCQGTVHRVRCIDSGTIVEASSHDDPDDCVRLEPSET